MKHFPCAVGLVGLCATVPELLTRSHDAGYTILLVGATVSFAALAAKPLFDRWFSYLDEHAAEVDVNTSADVCHFWQKGH